MAPLPAIPPHPMPTEDELPTNTAGWVVDPRRAVLLAHDMQEYFLRPFPDSPRTELVANATALRDGFAASSMPVAYTAQPGGMTVEQRGLLRDFWGDGMTTEPEHRAVVPSLNPAPDDWVLTKWRYSAFAHTDLLDRLRAAGRDQLVCCGVYAHVGILSTLIDALAHDIQAFLVADAVADFTPEHHRRTCEYAAARCAVVTTTSAVLSRLDVPAAAR